MGSDLDAETLASKAIGCGLHIHKSLGPGLLESAYEAFLTDALQKQGLHVERQKQIGAHFDGVHVDVGFRIDLLIEGQLVIELKSVEMLLPVHGKQLLTYLRLMNLQLGLLMNFGSITLREGLRRVVNNYDSSQTTHLNIHKTNPNNT